MNILMRRNVDTRKPKAPRRNPHAALAFLFLLCGLGPLDTRARPGPKAARSRGGRVYGHGSRKYDLPHAPHPKGPPR